MTKSNKNNKKERMKTITPVGASAKNKPMSIKEAWQKGCNLDSFLDDVMESKKFQHERNKRLEELEAQLAEQKQEYKRAIHKDKIIKGVSPASSSKSSSPSTTSYGAYHSGGCKVNSNSSQSSVPKHPTQYPNYHPATGVVPKAPAKNAPPQGVFVTPSGSPWGVFSNPPPNARIEAEKSVYKQEAEEREKEAEAYRKIEERLQRKTYELRRSFYNKLTPGDLLSLKRSFGGLSTTVPIDIHGIVPHLGYDFYFDEKHKTSNWASVKAPIAPEIKADEPIMFLGFVEYENPEELILPCRLVKAGAGWTIKSPLSKKPDGDPINVKIKLYGAKWLYNGKTFISHKFPEIKNLKALTGTLPSEERPSEERQSFAPTSNTKPLPPGVVSPGPNGNSHEESDPWSAEWWRNDSIRARYNKLLETQADKLGYKSIDALKEALSDTHNKLVQKKEEHTRKEMEAFAKHNKLVELADDISIGCVKRKTPGGRDHWVTKMFINNKENDNSKDES